MPKRVYQPKKKKRIRTHGFRIKMASHDGRNVIKRRRAKGRTKLSV
ncbi:MAG TPA: 50S ribosomal protein L34 [Spirochaetia bacterium]|jgi:large subunit ribosomal protein L34|nr:50S ribosomal protein L34 [Spirochaetia bacterium]